MISSEFPINSIESLEQPIPEKDEASRFAHIKGFLQEKLNFLAERGSPKVVETAALYEQTLPEGLRAFSYETGMKIRMQVTDRLAERSLRSSCPEGIKFEKNENLKPISNLIEEGISAYENANTDAEVYWPTDGLVVDLSTLYESSAELLQSQDSNLTDSTLGEDILKRTIQNLKEVHPRAHPLQLHLLLRRFQ